jgi:hypothetical protein
MFNGLATHALKSESFSKVSEMDYRTLRDLVRQGENEHLEFKLKSNHPEKIVREIVAFANTNGGTLLVGVGDDKTIPGLKFVDEDEYILVRAIERYTSPPIHYEIERVSVAEERDVLVFQIPRSREKPHAVKLTDDPTPRVYVRVQDRSVQASKEMRQILKKEADNQDGIGFVYGQKEQILMRILEENKKITLEGFAQAAKLPLWLASKTLVRLVLANVIKILPEEGQDSYMRV